MKQLAWLIGLLAATPALYAACGGDEATTTETTTTTGTAGTGGATGSGGSGGATAGGAGGTAGTAGGAGTAGKGGTTSDASVPDGRTPCGTVPNGCTGNQTGTNVCDATNNRCVECLSNADCADEATQKTCDLTPSTMGMMLPRSVCVVCVTAADCPMGATCTMNNCVTPCGTANCTTNPTGTNICDAPNNRCVDCMNDGDCAVETTNKFCDVTTLNMAGLPVYSCEQCLADAHCAAGQSCIDTECVTVCGTAQCATNPTGNDKCDLPNNRCVDCMTDADCAVEMGNPYCDTTLNTAGLARYACEECVTNAHCPAGQVCFDNNCEAGCATDADCSADGGGNNPHCNPTTMVCSECGADAHCSGNQPYCSTEGECVECMSDAHCAATPMTPLCRLSDFNCVQCIGNDNCTAPMTCGRNGNCSGGGGMDGGGMPPPVDAGGGGG
jgi:Cys-rich repeat protein